MPCKWIIDNRHILLKTSWKARIEKRLPKPKVAGSRPVYRSHIES